MQNSTEICRNIKHATHDWAIFTKPIKGNAFMDFVILTQEEKGKIIFKT